MRARLITIALLVGSCVAAPGLCRFAAAAELRSDLTLLGQVREGDQSHETEAPGILYGDLGVNGLRHGTSVDTYFGLGHDLARGEGLFTDFYAGSIRVPGAIPGVDFTLGRQFLSETPGGAFVADAGKIRFDPGGPVALTVFGGQPRYFEPTDGVERLSQDEQIFGGSLRTTKIRNGYMSLGYLQQDRDQKTLRQLVTAAAAKTFTGARGLPNIYGSAAYDADRQNLDQVIAGFQTFLAQPRLSLNFESGYYKPQDQGEYVRSDPNRRENPIFELFSVSRMLQFRGGLRYTLSQSLFGEASYSYQNFERIKDADEDGHLGNVAVVWLPGGDGLEMVRVEYYAADSGGGQLNGGRAYYESKVYDRIVFRVKGDVAHYDKANNQRNVAVSTLLGLGYEVLQGWICEINLEANRNKRFDDEFRFGFWITYNGRYRLGGSQAAAAGAAS